MGNVYSQNAVAKYLENSSILKARLKVVFNFLFFFVSRGLDLHSAVPKIAVNHATRDVYSPKAFETCIHGQCYEYCFLYCV